MRKSILVFSYYTNMPGACQAEWVDDRIFAFIRKGYQITMVSGTCCFTHSDPQIKHLKAPALSPHAARYEYEEIKRRNIPAAKNIGYAYIKIMASMDRLLEKLTIRSGEGRWTWFITSFLKAIFSGNCAKYDFVYSTGGPASAHLAGILIAKLYGKKIIAEFQDPLSGTDIGRNRLSQRGLAFFEKRIIRYADTTIYCTRNAMLAAQKLYPSLAGKISYVYPGSNAVENHLLHGSENSAPGNNGGEINITYLGSLYQSRNLDTLMQAIEELLTEGFDDIRKIKVNIYGNMNTDIRERIMAFPFPGFFLMHGLVSRDEAMQKALEAEVLLLVQNKDERSVATIPFKTYDYLHTGRLIVGLIYKNNEIEEMLQSHGHLTCQVNDVAGIKIILKNIIQYFSRYQNAIAKSSYTPDLATDQMLSLLNNNLSNKSHDK